MIQLCTTLYMYCKQLLALVYCQKLFRPIQKHTKRKHVLNWNLRLNLSHRTKQDVEAILVGWAREVSGHSTEIGDVRTGGRNWIASFALGPSSSVVYEQQHHSVQWKTVAALVPAGHWYNLIAIQEVKVIWQKAATLLQRSMPLCKPTTGMPMFAHLQNCPFLQGDPDPHLMHGYVGASELNGI